MAGDLARGRNRRRRKLRPDHVVLRSFSLAYTLLGVTHAHTHPYPMRVSAPRASLVAKETREKEGERVSESSWV